MPISKTARLTAVLSLVALLAASTRLPTTLEGRVTSGTDSTAVVGATVTLVEADRTTSTDSLGRFTFGGFEVVGHEQLRINHPDYAEVVLPLGSPESSRAWNLEIVIMPFVMPSVSAPEERP
jgi:hypothetical protein